MTLPSPFVAGGAWAALWALLAARPLVWAYLLGAALAVFFAASAKKAAPASPYRTRRAWLRAQWRGLAVRWLVATGFFVAWGYDPAWVRDWLGLPLNPGTAFLYGLLMDGALYLAAARFRILDGMLPKVNGQGGEPPPPAGGAP